MQLINKYAVQRTNKGGSDFSYGSTVFAHLANKCLVNYSVVNLTFACIHFKFEHIILKTLIRFCFPVTQLFGQAVARPPTLPLDPSRKGAVTNSLLCIFQTITVRNASQCVPFLVTDTLIFLCTASELPPYQNLTGRACALLWYLAHSPDTVRADSHVQVKNSHFKCVGLNVWGGEGFAH